MARNAEKAMTMLARWRAYTLQQEKGSDRRPYLASECNDVKKCEKWRSQIISEISKKVAQIQNAGMGEFRLRDMNDEINKLFREKTHWERRINELIGDERRKYKWPRMLDKEGKEIPGSRGYRYFGAAKDLPGVRELFQQEAPKQNKKTRAELSKDIDADYYGYRDDDDGILAPLEKKIEKEAIAHSVAEWKSDKEERMEGKMSERMDDDEEDIYSRIPEPTSDDEKEMDAATSGLDYIAHVPVPTQQEIEEALVRRKKMELLEQYASESLVNQSEEAKQLLGL